MLNTKKTYLNGCKKITSIIIFVGVIFSSNSYAQNPADAAYNAWIRAFLVKGDVDNQKGVTFFAKSLTGPDHAKPDDTWRHAISIMIVQDTYLRTRNPEQWKLVDLLLTDYMRIYGTDFSWNKWNDDLAWISIAFIRGYQITGEKSYRDMAVNLWNLAYNRDWDTTLGGGIWENREERPGKEALSNNPFVISGLALYEATGNSDYFNKSIAIYSWVRNNIFDTVTGQVHQGKQPPNQLIPGDNVYNSGTFVLAANTLYRMTGDTTYYNDAQLAINFVINRNDILNSSDNSQNSQWAYWFIKALTEFCNDHDRWPEYNTWLLDNAKSAWDNRDPKTQLTGNDWNRVYKIADSNTAGPMPSSSGVAIWQLIARPAVYRIINKNSGKALDLSAWNRKNGAAITQWGIGGQDTLNLHWYIEPTEQSNHSKIISRVTRKSASIVGNSTQPLAVLHSWSYRGNNPSQQFDLIAATNGYVKIKNVRSGLILEVKDSSLDDGATVQQQTDQGRDNQLWKLQQVGASSSSASSKPASSVPASSKPSSSKPSSSKAASSTSAAACGKTLNVVWDTRTELSVDNSTCIRFDRNLSGKSMQVWDSDSNSSCDYRGTLISVDGNGTLVIDSNYVTATNVSGTTFKFNGSCSFVKVRAY